MLQSALDQFHVSSVNSPCAFRSYFDYREGTLPMRVVKWPTSCLRGYQLSILWIALWSVTTLPGKQEGWLATDLPAVTCRSFQ